MMVAPTPGSGVNIQITAEDKASAVFAKMADVVDRGFSRISGEAGGTADAVSKTSKLIELFGGDKAGLENVISALEQIESSGELAQSVFAKLVGLAGSLGAMSPWGILATAIGGAAAMAVAYYEATNKAEDSTAKLAERIKELAKDLESANREFSGMTSGLSKANQQFGMSDTEKGFDDLERKIKAIKDAREELVQKDQAKRDLGAQTWKEQFIPDDLDGPRPTRLGPDEEREMRDKGAKDIFEIDAKKKAQKLEDLRIEQRIKDELKEQTDATAARLKLEGEMQGLRNRFEDAGKTDLEKEHSRIKRLGLEEGDEARAHGLADATDFENRNAAKLKNAQDALEGLRKDAASRGLNGKTALQNKQDDLKASGLQGADLQEALDLAAKLDGANKPKTKAKSDSLGTNTLESRFLTRGQGMVNPQLAEIAGLQRRAADLISQQNQEVAGTRKDLADIGKKIRDMASNFQNVN
jgi:translation elongation factor EF-1beta